MLYFPNTNRNLSTTLQNVYLPLFLSYTNTLILQLKSFLSTTFNPSFQSSATLPLLSYHFFQKLSNLSYFVFNYGALQPDLGVIHRMHLHFYLCNSRPSESQCWTAICTGSGTIKFLLAAALQEHYRFIIVTCTKVQLRAFFCMPFH